MKNLVLEVLIPDVGPSVNKMYVGVMARRGKKMLTNEGRAFKNMMHQHVVDAWKAAGMPEFPQNTPMELMMCLRYPTLHHKNGNLINLDVTNRIKLAEDGLAEALGLDDRSNFRVVLEKCEGGPKAMLLRLYTLEEMPKWPI